MRRISHSFPFRFRTCFFALSILSIASVGVSASASSVDSLDPIVVTASRVDQKLADVLPSTTLLTREDLDDSQAPDVLTLLRRQAGIEIAQSGGVGANASLFMRGANSNQVLVLIDGVRINSVASGAPLLSQLMLDEIDRIEIVRGNVSSLYGSEAIGGVVQIFTRGSAGPGDKPAVGADARFGSDRTRALSVHGSASLGAEGARTSVSLELSHRFVDGFSAIDPDRAPLANPDRDGYRNTSAAVQLRQQIGDSEIGARALESWGKLDFDSAFDGPAETHREQSRLSTASIFARLHPTASWNSDLQYGEARDRSISTSSAPFSFATGTTENLSKQISWHNRIALAPEQTATAGYEHLDQRGTSSNYKAVFNRRVDSFMLGYVGDFDAHRVQLNVRNDAYSDFEDANTALAAYGYRFASNWTAIAQASNAYKAPSFNDLYFPFFGNPRLKPEHARSIELGLQYARRKDYFRASLFRTRTRGLIVFDPTISAANNIDRARVSGIELTGGTTLAGWQLSANLTLQRAIDEKTDQALLRRAHRNFNMDIAKRFGPWRLGADVQAAGARYDFDINTFQRVRLPGYTLTNFSARYALDSRASIGVALTNAFDRRYRLVDGYNTAGRVGMVSLAANF